MGGGWGQQKAQRRARWGRGPAALWEPGGEQWEQQKARGDGSRAGRVWRKGRGGHLTCDTFIQQTFPELLLCAGPSRPCDVRFLILEAVRQPPELQEGVRPPLVSDQSVAAGSVDKRRRGTSCAV